MFEAGSPELVLSIDAGTTSFKASLIDAAYRVVASAEEPTHVVSTAPGRREIDMTELGETMFRVLSDLVARANEASETGANSANIVGIAITGQGDGAWLLDEHREPVGPAILWNDARASAEFLEMRESGEVDALRRQTRGAIHPGSLPVIARYLRHHAPEVLAKTRHHLNCKDWIRYLLTGVLETDATDATQSYLDTRENLWRPEIFEALGDISLDTTVPLALADDTRPLGQEAATRLGLTAGIPVGVGTMDVAAAGYAFCGNEPGRAWVIVGTTSFIGVVKSEIPDEAGEAGGSGTESGAGHWMAYGSPGRFLNSFAPLIGTPLLDWARTLLGRETASWAEFEALAASSQAEQPPVTLPYFAPSGERAPFIEPFARGSMHGLSYDTTPADIAKSVYLGLALSIAECIRALGVTGPIAIAGGGSASDLLCQLIADYSGHEIERPELSAEAGMIGSVRRLRDALGGPVGGGSAGSASTDLAGARASFTPRVSAAERTAALGHLRRIRANEISTWKLRTEQK